MTIKERIRLLKEAFPDAGKRKLGRIIGCDGNTVKYHTNPKYRANQHKRINVCSKERVAKHKFILIQLLGGQCSKCGYRGCDAALDFHHIDPKQKHKKVANLLPGNFDNAVEEAKKCILLCANCHREHHEKENDLVTKTDQNLLQDLPSDVPSVGTLG